MLLQSRTSPTVFRIAPPLSSAVRPPSIVVSFGKRLRALRMEHGYTQTQLADYLGIDRSFISDVERGKKNMSLTYLETVAQGFKITLSELTRDL